MALAMVVWTGVASAAGCGPVRAVATFSILGDLVRQVGGGHVEVATLVGPGSDVHSFSPAPGDARILARADIVVVNGLGLEGWIDRLIRASGTKAPVVTASGGVATMEDADPHDHGGHDHGHADPHAWQNVANVKVYVANIRDGLSKVCPDHAADYAAAAAAYTDQLDALDREVQAAMARIPPQNRRLITTHDAFGYFAAAYGLTILAPQGLSTESAASPRDVAAIITQIRREKVPAVFLETVTDPRQMERIAHESGARIGGEIYSDALSPPEGPAPTYLAMIRSNVKAFEAALSSR
ncbi:zinc ABC transporter substrate-binding protein [Methylobacterium sp. J-076]|nr:zinc ABC transporter substrate-binding protein [Methylobacterium sp. J-076]MCJ2013422.1 zinc ABC transporter substrate-binding protein [Methylobacterium sp. J-076]